MPLIKNTGTCTDEDVRKRAYENYLARVARNDPGDEKEDWYLAERAGNRGTVNRLGHK